ncbi:MAG TPA: DUF2959 family protein [Chiayiivirga sp.]|nr:DUF2959 family protein [Chiayiivirga sp.]
MSLVRIAISACLLVLTLGACQSAYYGALETVGIEKREVLVDRVATARKAQAQAQEAYVDALDAFRAVVAFDGGDLERTYNRLRGKAEGAREQASALGGRIDAVESVANALFKEWEAELAQYRDASLRARSREQLAQTKARSAQVLAAMRRAQASFEPALARLEDQVLFLKHNLNASAIGSIRDELPRVQADADRLKRDIEAAVAEADRFLAEFGK